MGLEEQMIQARKLAQLPAGRIPLKERLTDRARTVDRSRCTRRNASRTAGSLSAACPDKSHRFRHSRISSIRLHVA